MWQGYTNRQGTSLFGAPGPYKAAHSVLCGLINTFRTEVDQVGDTPVEALPFGSLRFGVRPILYLILRHEYLWRGGAVVCSNDRCGRFFVSCTAALAVNSVTWNVECCQYSATLYVCD